MCIFAKTKNIEWDMANTKDYGLREMIYDQCFSTGKEWTGKQLMDIVNKQLVERGMRPFTSRTTFMQDIQEMNEKFKRLYQRRGIVWADRNKRRYYRYRKGVSSIYNKELTQDEVVKMQQLRDVLQEFKTRPDFEWMNQMLVHLNQNIIGRQKEIVSFEGATRKDKVYMMILFEAIKNRQVLDVVYRRVVQESEQMVLHPYYLKQYRSRWYLLAKRNRENDIEAFALDCIEELKVNETVKYQGSKVLFKNYFDHLVGVTMPKETTVEHLELWADASLVPLLMATPIHKTQMLTMNDDKSCTMTLDVMINDELEQELMFYADRMVVKSPTFFRDHMMQRLERGQTAMKQVEESKPSQNGYEPVAFTFKYIHEDKNDWMDIHYRICLGQMTMDSMISDYSNDWGSIRSSLERIVDHGRTVIELKFEEEPTKIELKKYGDMVHVLVTPNYYDANEEQMAFNGWVRCKVAVKVLYLGLAGCLTAFPKEYVDGCPYTFDVVFDEFRSEKIENYLKAK